MGKCPVCNAEIQGRICAVCGFDSSADREAYPTLTCPADARQAKSNLKNTLKKDKQGEDVKAYFRAESDPYFGVWDGRLQNYIGTQESILIPADVRIIGSRLFASEHFAKKICLQSGVEKIESEAFLNCSVEHITLPNTLRELGPCCFAESVLQSVQIPGSVKCIPSGAFQSCYELQTVQLSKGLEEIGESAFSWCSVLREIRLPDSLQKIEKRAFVRNEALKSIRFPEALKVLGKDCFAFCDLRNVKIPGSVTEIGEEAFFSNIKLTRVCLAPGVQIIGKEAFGNCWSVTEIQLPEGLKEIGPKAFWGCAALKKIVIPASVKRIGAGAFERCRKLQDITLLSADTVIEENAFKDCPGKVKKPRKKLLDLIYRKARN